MRNRILFLVLILFCIRAEAQNVVGTPLNAPYATLLDWLIKPAPNKEVMPDWIKSELMRHARPEHREFARSIKITLLGTKPESPCYSIKSFALSRSSSDGRPEILLCVRTVQYLEQVNRALEHLLLNEIYKDTHSNRRIQLLENYLLYLNRRLNADRDIADAPEKFSQFCTVEFYVLVNALGFFGNDCPPEAIAKHASDFNRFYWGGGFFPDSYLSGIPTEKRQEVVWNYTQSNLTSQWRGIWRSAALHEFGHLVSCHQGIFPGIRCQKTDSRREAFSSVHAEPLEIQADGYVISRVVAANRDYPEKILATANALIKYNLSRSVWSNGEDLRFDRLSANEETYKRMYRKILSNKEIMEILREGDVQVVSELEAFLSK